LIGIYGIFGYHALYFSALKLAPPAEANLINYLWPALIVIIYSIITFKKIDIYLIFATILGLASTIILIPISENDRMNGESLYLIGYILAFLAAVNWATYSVALRFFSQIKSDSLSLAIAASAVLGLACHLLFESWEPPTWPTGWLAIIFLGLGPVGAAFFLWDMGMKRGNVALLGILSYATPVCSTLALAAIGATEIDAQILAACILIVSAALLATWKQPT
jgi:drug/metabolite transporter (DMT)-like permease